MKFSHFKALVWGSFLILKIQDPVTVVGDIHGQYQDLMRFFDLFSAPGGSL